MPSFSLGFPFFLRGSSSPTSSRQLSSILMKSWTNLDKFLTDGTIVYEGLQLLSDNTDHGMKVHALRHEYATGREINMRSAIMVIVITTHRYNIRTFMVLMDIVGLYYYWVIPICRSTWECPMSLLNLWVCLLSRGCCSQALGLYLALLHGVQGD